MGSIVWNCTDDLSLFFLLVWVGLWLGHFFLMQKTVSAVLDFDPRYVLGDRSLWHIHMLHIADYLGHVKSFYKNNWP